MSTQFLTQRVSIPSGSVRRVAMLHSMLQLLCFAACIQAFDLLTVDLVLCVVC